MRRTVDSEAPHLGGFMRVATIAPEQMTPEQRSAHDEVVAGVRGRLPAPMRAWIHSRYGTSLPPTLSELAILVTARYWTSHFEWYAHKRDGLKAGLDPAVITAIATRREPVFADPAQSIVYQYSRTLHEKKAIPQSLHDAAVATLGERGVVELVGILGYYTLVSMTLNAFDIGLPENEPIELQD
jgi:4-carboxymuconolactone decarboxylase